MVTVTVGVPDAGDEGAVGLAPGGTPITADADAENRNMPAQENITDTMRIIFLEFSLVFCKVFIFVTMLKI